VERIAKGLPEQPFSMEAFLRDLELTVRLEITKMLIYVPVMAGAFLLSLLLPVVGQGIYVLFGAFFTATYNAVDYTDWPLARRGFGPADRIVVLRRRFTRMLGLGTAVWLLLIVPILGLLAMPAGVVGGTLLVLDMEAEGLLEPPRRPR
jgi:CysZ protein